MKPVLGTRSLSVKINRSLPVVIVLALLVAACAKRISPADQLWLPADATIEANAISMKPSRSMYKDGSADVVFIISITGSSQKEQVTNTLSKHFEHDGWQPRGHQWLNPGLTTSFVDGWKHVCGCVIWTDPQGKVLPRPETFTWHGEWQNQHGDVITYSLIASDGLRGYAQYVPAKLIEHGLTPIRRR